MIKAEHSIIIKRPVEEVWQFLSHIENVGKWDPEFLELRPTTEGSTRVGSKVQYRRHFLGYRPRGFFQVSAYVPNQILEIQVQEEQITGQIRYSFEPVEGGTRLTAASEGEVSGWLTLLTAILIPMLERDNLKDLVKIKRVIEGLY